MGEGEGEGGGGAEGEGESGETARLALRLSADLDCLSPTPLGPYAHSRLPPPLCSASTSRSLSGSDPGLTPIASVPNAFVLDADLTTNCDSATIRHLVGAGASYTIDPRLQTVTNTLDSPASSLPGVDAACPAVPKTFVNQVTSSNGASNAPFASQPSSLPSPAPYRLLSPTASSHEPLSSDPMDMVHAHARAHMYLTPALTPALKQTLTATPTKP